MPVELILNYKRGMRLGFFLISLKILGRTVYGLPYKAAQVQKSDNETVHVKEKFVIVQARKFQRGSRDIALVPL